MILQYPYIIFAFFQECDNVILIFSVKESGKFQGNVNRNAQRKTSLSWYQVLEVLEAETGLDYFPTFMVL